MQNRVSEIRRLIRRLRVSMLEAEAIMRAQIDRDEDCSFVAGDILKMRAVMAGLAQERMVLGDNEPIVVNSCFRPGRAPSRYRFVHRHPVPKVIEGTCCVLR